MLNVAISVDSAIDYGAQAARVVSAACEEVIGERRCPVASELQPGTVAAWTAIVHPNDRALSSVRIEFRDRTAAGVLIEERSLTFSGRDSQESRLASAGSVIAALVAAREGSPPRPAPPARVMAEAPRPDWGVDVAALVAPGLGDAPYRVGGLWRAYHRLAGRPFVFAAARYAAHPGNPGITWWTLSAGAGARLGARAARVHLEVAGEVVVERTSLEAERGAEHDSAGEYGWGGRVGVSAVWACWLHGAVVLGVDGTLVLPRINLVVAEQPAGSVPAVSGAVTLGLRFEP